MCGESVPGRREQVARKLTICLICILPGIRAAQHIVHALPIEQNVRLDLRAGSCW